METVSLVDAAWDKLKKMFDGQDSFRYVNLSGEESAHAWDTFGTRFDGFMENNGMNAAKLMPNSFLVVDIDSEESSSIEPYVYFVDISNVLDYFCFWLVSNVSYKYN